MDNVLYRYQLNQYVTGFDREKVKRIRGVFEKNVIVVKEGLLKDVLVGGGM